MDKMLQSATTNAENIPPNQPNTPPPPACNSGNNGTPDRLKVPKPFKYPERYTSPTDQMMPLLVEGFLLEVERAASSCHPLLVSIRFNR